MLVHPGWIGVPPPAPRPGGLPPSPLPPGSWSSCSCTPAPSPPTPPGCFGPWRPVTGVLGILSEVPVGLTFTNSAIARSVVSDSSSLNLLSMSSSLLLFDSWRPEDDQFVSAAETDAIRGNSTWTPPMGKNSSVPSGSTMQFPGSSWVTVPSGSSCGSTGQPLEAAASGGWFTSATPPLGRTGFANSCRPGCSNVGKAEVPSFSPPTFSSRQGRLAGSQPNKRPGKTCDSLPPRSTSSSHNWRVNWFWHWSGALKPVNASCHTILDVTHREDL